MKLPCNLDTGFRVVTDKAGRKNLEVPYSITLDSPLKTAIFVPSVFFSVEHTRTYTYMRCVRLGNSHNICEIVALCNNFFR